MIFCTIIILIIYTVLVSGRSWPTPRLRVPQNSTVLFSCSLNDSLAYWTIDLASDGIDSQLQFVESGGQRSLLNANGVYELESVETATAPTLRLLVNDSTENNQTKIFCFGSLGNVNQLVTTLILYGKQNYHIMQLVNNIDS